MNIWWVKLHQLSLLSCCDCTRRSPAKGGRLYRNFRTSCQVSIAPGLLCTLCEFGTQDLAHGCQVCFSPWHLEGACIYKAAERVWGRGKRRLGLAATQGVVWAEARWMRVVHNNWQILLGAWVHTCVCRSLCVHLPMRKHPHPHPPLCWWPLHGSQRHRAEVVVYTGWLKCYITLFFCWITVISWQKHQQ